MKKLACLVFLALLASTALLAQVDIPLHNWTVPPYTVNTPGGIHTMTDASPPRLFIGLQPCRLLDTRPGAINPLDGDGIYQTDETRTYDLDGLCGLPTGVDAVSLNFTVTNTGNNPYGYLKAWPTSPFQAEPNVSTLNWNGPNQTVANAAIVALSATGSLSVKTGNAGAHVIIDVNGYFADTLGNPQNSLLLINNSDNYTAFFGNTSTTCASVACGVYAETASGHAIRGHTAGAASVGVYGDSNSYYGVLAQSGSHDALAAFGGRDGAYLQGMRHGVVGVSTPFPSGTHYGVMGHTSSDSNNSAGVIGTGAAEVPFVSFGGAGVRGESTAIGVLGVSTNHGVLGFLVDGTGTQIASGALGYMGYGVYAAFGGMGGTGPKYFIDPHPTDASKVIRYIALEGNEPGTYFRGRGKFERGMARIAVPEDFRMVTDAEGLSVQVTPIGAMATVAVLKADLNEIVVQSSRNVEFYYTVNGIRRTFKHLTNPIGDGQEYMPRSAEERMPAYSEAQKQLLIQNGTYNPDGTVNMETARRLGWDRIWEERARPAPAPAP